MEKFIMFYVFAFAYLTHIHNLSSHEIWMVKEVNTLGTN